jgi:predicted NBD/HSP70 family sugar kinase
MSSSSWRTGWFVLLGQLRQLAVRLHLQRPVRLGIDGGGTKIIAAWNTRQGRVCRKYDTRNFPRGFAELLDRIISEMPRHPTHACLGLAGRHLENGTVQLTNVPDWGLLDVAELERRTGCRITFCNDMVIAHRGLLAAARGAMVMVKQGVLALVPKVLVMTISTGLNDSTGEPAESGHVGWQPYGEIETLYQQFGQRDVGSSLFTVEQAIAGGGGWFRMAMFVATQMPIDHDKGQTLETADKAGEVSPLIEKWAREGDEFALAIIELYVGILAAHLRGRIMATLATEVILIGSVGTHLADFIAPGGAFYDVFTERLCAPGAHQAVLLNVSIYANNDENAPAIGAYELAS